MKEGERFKRSRRWEEEKIKRKCVKGVGNDKEGNKRGRKNQYIQ